MKLYPHQEVALDLTEGFNRCAYYLDMGLGKTFVGAEKMYLQNNQVNLIICQKSKVQDWIDHMNTYYPCYTVIDLTAKKGIEQFQAVVAAGADVVGVINYELLFRRSYFSHIDGFTMMLDESSMIQNETAKRSKYVLQMHPESVILLSGTPTAGKYEKLWSQLHLLGWGISKKLFYQQYVVQEWIDTGSGFNIPVITGYKNVDRLKAKLAAHGAVFMKTDEVMDLPKQQHINLFVKASAQYKRFMKTCLITVAGHQFVGDTGLTKRLYARQLCGHYNPDKLQAFGDLIGSTEDRLIVFYNFNEELTALQQIARQAERPVSVVNSSVKDLEQYEHSEQSITFIQYQAGAMGLNLQKANKIIYFTLPERSELFEQSKKRIHRIGQEKTCFYYYLLCRSSVEIDIYQTLKMRKDYTDALFEKYSS